MPNEYFFKAQEVAETIKGNIITAYRYTKVGNLNVYVGSMFVFLGISFAGTVLASCATEYGFGAYEDLSGHCQCSSGYVWGEDFMHKDMCVSCTSKFGVGAVSDYAGGCKCGSGYVVENNKCVSCSIKYGYGAEADYLAGGCKCSDDYFWGKDILGNDRCVSGSEYCRDIIGLFSKYNSISNKCECSSGYEMSLTSDGKGLQCQSCLSKLGYHSSYNYLSEKCECDDGYTLGADGQCVEKQNNVYFKLVSLDTDKNKIVAYNEYSGVAYLLGYGVGCYDWTMRRYTGHDIVVNLGTDYDVDLFDKIVLQDDNETCDIISVKTVSRDYTLGETAASSGISVSPTPSPTSSCLDMVNGYLGTDGECYCNAGFAWDSSMAKCTAASNPASSNTTDTALVARLKGRILLQVESHGEAWYVNPDDGKRYYMKDGTAAFGIMRKFALGITNADLDKIPVSTENRAGTASMVDRLKGKILLQVEYNGDAWYLYPDDGKRYFMGKPDDAYNLMRNLGLGITNADLSKIPVGTL